MKKIIVILFLVIIMNITGCTFAESKIKETSNFKIVSQVDYPDKEYKVKYLLKDKTNVLNSFSYNTYSYLYKDNENMIYSPASLYMALSMLAEGSNGNTYEEIKKIMGYNDLNDLRNINKTIFENNFYENDNGKAKLANSFWIDLDFDVLEDYTNVLKNNYYAEGFKCKFDSEAQDNMCKWINNKTFDFLNVKKDDFDIEDMSLILMNTIYFDNKWAVEFKESNTKKDLFYNYSSKANVDFMHHKFSGSYIETEKLLATIDYFKNGNTITYIMPNGNFQIKDILNDADLKKIIYNDITYNFRDVNIYVPKFKYQNSLNLKDDVLIKMGLNDVFDPNKADLSKISNQKNCVDYIKQIAGIELSEEGVKAAAVTIIGDKVTSSGPLEEVTFKLNKPFIYFIKDSSGVILFIGIINNL